MAETLTARRVREVLTYDSSTGILRWKARTPEMFECKKYSRERECARWNATFAGKIAGADKGDGYLRVTIDNNAYALHRVVWFYEFGKWPSGCLDHIDGNPSNNRLSNLREATNQQNCFNQRIRSTNKSGRKGVYWKASHNKWAAQIRANGKSKTLGYFDSVENAAIAYASAAEKYFGEFSRS